MSEEELDLVPTGELFAALKRRCESLLLVTSKSVNDGESDQEVCYAGGFVSAIGLAEYAKARLLATYTPKPPHAEGI